jgi:hypothetical protein
MVKVEEATKRLVASMEEMGGTLMLVGVTCLFIFLMLETSLGFAVPVFSLIVGAGAVFTTKIIRKMVPEL